MCLSAFRVAGAMDSELQIHVAFFVAGTALRSGQCAFCVAGAALWTCHVAGLPDSAGSEMTACVAADALVPVGFS